MISATTTTLERLLPTHQRRTKWDDSEKRADTEDKEPSLQRWPPSLHLFLVTHHHDQSHAPSPPASAPASALCTFAFLLSCASSSLLARSLSLPPAFLTVTRLALLPPAFFNTMHRQLTLPLLALAALAKAAQVNHYWNVSWANTNPDGMHERRAIGVNGTWPPPVIVSGVAWRECMGWQCLQDAGAAV